MRNKIWFMVLVLGLVSAGAGVGLSFVRNKTEPVIQKRILEEGVKPSLDLFFTPIGVENDFIAERVQLELGKDDWGRTLTTSVFKGKKNGKVVVAALQTSAGGFGGDISVLTAFDLENKKILGAKALDEKETKGLGKRVSDDSEPFVKQFQGMILGDSVALRSEGGVVDAISGATVSSKGFTNAVNKALILLRERADEITK